jgi:hypothetical protein
MQKGTLALRESRDRETPISQAESASEDNPLFQCIAGRAERVDTKKRRMRKATGPEIVRHTWTTFRRPTSLSCVVEGT